MGLLDDDYAGLTPAEQQARERFLAQRRARAAAQTPPTTPAAAPNPAPADPLWISIVSWILAAVLVVLVIGGVGLGLSLIAGHLWWGW